MLPEPTRDEQPGLILGIGSIAAGVASFGIPLLGMIASCVAIWLGIAAYRRGHRARYSPSMLCGALGSLAAVLGIVFWVSVIFFGSYH